MKQLLSCINFLHKNDIIHRDLKPENLLLESNKDFHSIKLIDFGISLIYDKKDFLTERIGTPYYIAPEVWKRKYNEKCDVWSAGVIMYILLSGEPPFNGQSDEEIKQKILKGKFKMEGKTWKAISDEAKDLIKKLLTFNHEDRQSAEDALSHPWVVEMSEGDIDSEKAVAALGNLKSFRAQESMKKATCAYIAGQLLSKKEKEDLAETFKLLDANNDGKLSREEIKEGYEKLHGFVMEDEQIDALFEAVDTDNSGYIDYSEFVVAAMNEKNVFSDAKLKAAFDMFDKDGSGEISRQEIREALKYTTGVSDDQIDIMVKQVDENDDGEIDFEEFKGIMLSLQGGE